MHVELQISSALETKESVRTHTHAKNPSPHLNCPSRRHLNNVCISNNSGGIGSEKCETNAAKESQLQSSAGAVHSYCEGI
jgi:hypothetical protein